MQHVVPGTPTRKRQHTAPQSQERVPAHPGPWHLAPAGCPPMLLWAGPGCRRRAGFGALCSLQLSPPPNCGAPPQSRRCLCPFPGLRAPALPGSFTCPEYQLWAESPFSLSIARSRMEQKAQGSTRQSLAGCHLTQISDTPVLGFPHLQGKHSQRPRERSDCKATAKRSKIPQLRTHPSRVRLSPQAFACSRVTRVVQLGATTLSLETSPLSQPGGPSDAPPPPRWCSHLQGAPA